MCMFEVRVGDPRAVIYVRAYAGLNGSQLGIHEANSTAKML